MKTWQKVSLALAAVAIVGATAAFAAGTQGRGMFMKQMVTKRVAAAEDYIQATPEQRQVIEAARDNIVATMEQRIAAHKADRGQWLSLLTADTLDTSEIVAAAGKHADEIRATAAAVAPDLVKVHDVLTPAQRTKLADHLRSMRGHHGHGAGGDAGGFGGPGGAPKQ
ncbi:MAG TPA: periplasmic heavy metal sensor [Myxococcales bacterium]|nr:periplasmic heavy metal sensor [Myxococcales bacterium]